jgi:hypothetical protein
MSEKCKHKWYHINNFDDKPTNLYFCIGCHITATYEEMEEMENNIRYYVDNIGPDDVSWCDPFPTKIIK